MISLVATLVMANTFNIAADLAAMGKSLSLVIGGLNQEHALIFAAASNNLKRYNAVESLKSARRNSCLPISTSNSTALPSTSTFRPISVLSG